jgi:predicted lipoprotein with Yx(FWY)xxD motif
MFQKVFILAALFGSLTLAACGGGSGSGGSGNLYGGAPPPTQASNLPQQQTVAGQPAFVNPGNSFTLYFLDVDTASGGACIGTCLNEWLVLTPSAGAMAQGNFSIITRGDGTGKQWAYQNHPLYMFAGDSGPDQANGNGLTFDGGHWHVARPAR